MRFLSIGSSNASLSQKLWPILALLVLTIALPTAGVFWFMSRTMQEANKAMQNERAAAREDRRNANNSLLEAAAGQVELAWKSKLEELRNVRRQKFSPEAFEIIVRNGIADSALLYKEDHLIYPPPTTAFAEPERQAHFLWEDAKRLEKENAMEAAAVYGKIAQQVEEVNESAEALLEKAKCLNKAGRKRDAITVLTGDLGNKRYYNATHSGGWPLQPDSQMLALIWMKDLRHPLFVKTAEALFERLNNYGEPVMPSGQRCLHMKNLQDLWPECPLFKTQAAEEMALKFSKAGLAGLMPGRLMRTSDPEVWGYQMADKSVIALFREESLLKFLNAAISSEGHDADIKISLLAPGKTPTTEIPGKIINAISPEVWLTLNLKETDLRKLSGIDESGIDKYKYLSIGIVMTVAIALMSSILIWYLRRQVRLTRLKNDLIATVSHELKTPLASMRLLVDTLRDGHDQDTPLVRDYLEMISKENTRLSSLIEGFLTFSRMERNKAKFDRTLLRTGDIVQGALEAVGDRLHGPDCSLKLELAPDLPPVIGDRDALTTVLVNLLDNALKYTGSEKEILLRGFTDNGSVCLEVQDNGIGFSQSAAKKIFDRFYQVDQTLSRTAEGCGLGLSIVQFIITAHHGSVSAKSQPGKGSTFMVRLPAATTREDAHEQ
jgi:signal transduction histidine kinase